MTESTLSLKRLANLECDLDDTMRPSCTVHSGCFVLLFPHHHSIVMTRALVVMIATHDSDLIVRGAVIFGTNKQPECIVRRIGLCHRTCAPSRRCGHAHLPSPAALICTGLLSCLVNCPGTVCPRDRPHYTADARKKRRTEV